MSNLTPPPRKVFSPIIFFIAALFIAFVLLVVALVVWIAELVKSASIAALIVGGLFFVISLLIYLIAARKSIEYLHNRLETIYDVAYAARRGYRTAVKIFSSFFSDLF